MLNEEMDDKGKNKNKIKPGTYICANVVENKYGLIFFGKRRYMSVQ